MTLHVDGFPKLSGYVDLPDIAEILQYPFMLNKDIEDVYKYGGEFARYMLSKTPLKYNKLHTIVTSQVQYLTPEFTSVRSEITPHNDWHVDGNGFQDDAVVYVHLLQNQTCCNTEFNTHSITIPELDISTNQSEFNTYINTHDIGIQASMLPGNHIATMTALNIHRAVMPTKPVLRYMWRVTETDKDMNTKPYDPNASRMSYVYKYCRPFRNIEQHPNGSIFIHTN
jgi:hypothetical protein